MTIGEKAHQVAQSARKSGTAGVSILEFALLELLEVNQENGDVGVYLKLSDGRLLHQTPGYARLKAETADVVRRIDDLLAKYKEDRNRA